MMAKIHGLTSGEDRTKAGYVGGMLLNVAAQQGGERAGRSGVGSGVTVTVTDAKRKEHHYCVALTSRSPPPAGLHSLKATGAEAACKSYPACEPHPTWL